MNIEEIVQLCIFICSQFFHFHMLQGPDETNGFRQGWTTRQSLWTIKPINDIIDG